MFFFPVASVADSYSVSALENDRKKQLPPGTGRSRFFPPFREEDFAPKQ